MGSTYIASNVISFYRFESQLRLPQVPEMIFADNILQLRHQKGFGIEFNALDALKLVDPENDLLKVAVAKAWKDARYYCRCCSYVD